MNVVHILALIEQVTRGYYIVAGRNIQPPSPQFYSHTHYHNQGNLDESVYIFQFERDPRTYRPIDKKTNGWTKLKNSQYSFLQE